MRRRSGSLPVTNQTRYTCTDPDETPEERADRVEAMRLDIIERARAELKRNDLGHEERSELQAIVGGYRRNGGVRLDESLPRCVGATNAGYFARVCRCRGGVTVKARGVNRATPEEAVKDIPGVEVRAERLLWLRLQTARESA